MRTSLEEKMLSALKSALSMLERADCSTGYCCCGSKVDSHGVGDGHSPVDEGTYYQVRTMDELRSVIAEAEKL